jgi:asparagine synthase (glutamine-hydrolysing)
MGFGVPLDDWLREDLREWAESLLEENSLRQDGLLRPATVRAVWADHLAGRRDDQFRLWAVLMFQSWRRQWLR